MFRKVRLIAPYVRSLLMGAVVLPGLLASGAVFTGCEDEEDPQTHIDRMKDPEKRKNPLLNRPAIKRIIQAYSDADSEDKKDPNKPHVKELLDKAMEPLAQVCLEDSVKDQDRSKLVKFMADTRDPRAEPCLKKTLEDYKPDTNEDDVTNVLLAISAMKQKSLAPQVMKVYQTMEFSRPKAKPMGPHVIKALKVVIDKPNEDDFLKMLEPPIEGGATPASVNQGFWQQTAAFMLGELRSDKAAKPLVKLILTPTKAPLAQYALVSLVKIGKPAIAPVEALLKGEDTELMKFSEEEQIKAATKDTNGKISDSVKKAAKQAYIPVAAELLGNLGSEASTKPLLDVIAKASDEKNGDPTLRVIATIALTMIPKSKEAIEVYKKTYEDTKLDLEVTAGGAKELLATRAADFFEPSLVPWLVKNATDMEKPEKGKEKPPNTEMDPVRQVAFITCLKLMKKDQIGDCESLGNLTAVTVTEDEKTHKEKKEEVKVSKGYVRATTPCDAKDQKDDPESCKKPLIFDQAKTLLEACGDDVKCYISAATDEKNQKKDTGFTAIKALYMVAELGKDSDRDQIVDSMPKFTNDDVRNGALKVIESMTPKNGTGPADKLEGYFNKAEELNDHEKMLAYNIFLQAAARLRARSQ